MYYIYYCLCIFAYFFCYISVYLCNLHRFKSVCEYTYYVAAYGRLADSAVSQSERPSNKPEHVSVVV